MVLLTLLAPFTISKLVLSVPVTAGLSELMRILYPVPEGVPAGMVMLMLPDGLVPVTVVLPIAVGLAKLPLASLR